MRIDFEQRTISGLEKGYMIYDRQKLYTVLEELNFHWCEKEVRQFEALWNEGKSLQDIAEIFNRDLDETALLVLDRARRNKIKPRTHGILQAK
jgi:hypothetical protein